MSTCSDRSQVPEKRRVPDTGRGSRQIVLIEAGGFYPGIYGIDTIDACSQSSDSLAVSQVTEILL